MNKKYSLTEETKIEYGVTLHRIKANISFGIVTKGDLGGWIEKEDNLYQEGNAWVSGSARVSGNARVYGNAVVSGSARVSGDAWVSGNAVVSGNSQVSGSAQVSGNSQVYGSAQVSGNSQVYGSARCEVGWYFAYKEKDWDITEIPSGDGVLLVKDYKPPKEIKEETLSGKKVTVTIGDKTYTATVD